MERKCNNSICNYEAVCMLDNNGNPQCQCVEQFFEDEFCSKLKDHCSSNPCQNGGTCQSYAGHYNCECPSGFFGQMCTSQQNAFKGFHLHYNHIAPIGIKQSLMLIVQNLGTVETLLELYTLDCFIDGVTFTSTSGHFIKSNNLKSLGKRLGIKHSDNLPYNVGFYRITKASFWKPGINHMSLDFSDFGESEENFFRGEFGILVYDPTGKNCLPAIHLPHCLNPRKPLHMDIQAFNFIEPIVDSKCQLDSHIRISWTVKNYINTVVLHKFPKQSRTDLTIPPFTMWFNYRDDFIQSYLIEGDVLEIDGSNNHISKTILRCYVFVDSKPTGAFILGGPYRDANYKKQFVLDGSASRDYARPPNGNQRLQYFWSCTSDDDSENHYCRLNMGSGPRLVIPAKSLQLSKTYKFSLLVRSSINIYSSHRTNQTVKAVSHDSLFIHFICLRNCQHGKFSAGKLIHLKLECIKCPPGEITYSVFNEIGTKIANDRQVILVEESKEEISLKAEAILGSMKGETSINLILNQPPSQGTCSIKPLSGIEYETVFEISCLGYVDEDKPIDYKFSAGNNTLDHSGDETFTTRLFRTSEETCAVKIKICDDIGACTEVQLQVSLKPITNAVGSWLTFLSQNETNLKAIIASGDKTTAFILIETVIQHMTPSEYQEEFLKHIVKCFREVEADRLLVVEQFLALGNNLFGVMNATSESAVLISELFLKVSKGLLHSIKNLEVLELQVETHEVMMNNIAESLGTTAIEVEEFPVVHNAEPIPPEDPFKENYTDYGELDIQDVIHISNWLQAFKRMHRCLQVMGVVSAFVQLPGEIPLVIKRKGFMSMSVKLDIGMNVPLSWNESKTVFELPKEFLKSLDRNEVIIQSTIFQSNPLWWYPDQHPINSEVLSIGAYSKNLGSLNSRTVRSNFSFYMELKSSTEEILTHGIVQNDLEMLVYERLLPENSVLLVTFLPLDNDIRVLLLMGQRPRSFILKDATVVPASTENTTLYLINDKIMKRKAFLGISSSFRVEFSFTLTIKMCTTWDQSALEWTSKYCLVGNQTNATHIHCSCWHLSMFGAKVYPSFGHFRTSEKFVDHLAINFGMVTILSLIILLIFLFLWIAWRRDVQASENIVFIDYIHADDIQASHEYLVTIYTNGQTHAGTSSNVTIRLHGSLSKSPSLTVYSRPMKSIFQRNSKASFRVFLLKDLGVIKSVSLHHDGFGRYPKWNCKMVTVRDKVKKNQYTFLVDRWIYADSEPILIPRARKEELESRSMIFKFFLETMFANFYAEQSFSFTKLYGQFTAIERASVFILKTCISIMGTLIFFGPTTIFTYEMEREIYYSMLLDIQKLFFISCVCHIIGVAVGEVLYYFILKIKNNIGFFHFQSNGVL
ncbi:polycystin family receptor for egg jelly-like [Eupeodes corollae]|uniref:polycystin family receptor for egg jelly-like n=1 Tax=Eupeodes corollae TaxID=290404 RepID=UPI00249177BA|nr:polycystin family receptor for egg jelly-like [Eupeodes corollae]